MGVVWTFFSRLLFFSSFFLSLGDGPIFKKNYFNHKNIDLVRFRVKSANYYRNYGTFSTSLFEKCLKSCMDWIYFDMQIHVNIHKIKINFNLR